VSHADVIKAALAAVLGLTLDAHDRFDIAPASLSTLVLWEGGGKVVGLNAVPAA
jgi:broad specificity phosphatase PhoE